MKVWLYVGFGALALGAAVVARLILLPPEEDSSKYITRLSLEEQEELGLRDTTETNKDGSVRHVYVGKKIPDSELEDVSPAFFDKVLWVKAYKEGVLNKPDVVEWIYQPIFQNLNPFSIAEVEVNVKLKTPGVRTYQTTIHYTKFLNSTIPTSGVLYPYETSNYCSQATVSYPKKYWRADTEAEWAITRVRAYKKPPAQNTVLGLYELFLGNSTLDEVMDLLKKNPELVTLKDKESGINTTLLAFLSGNKAIIRYVLAHGGDPDSKDIWGAGIMHYAARSLGFDGVDIALELGKGASEKNLNGYTPLHYAARAAIPWHIKRLVENGADPDALTNNGVTPGYLAATICNESVMKALFKNGASKEFTNRGRSYLAMSIDDPRFVAELVKLGMSMEFKNPLNGETALLCAAHSGSLPTAEWLLKNGADDKAVDSRGRDVFEIAKESNTLKTDRFFRNMYDRVKAEMAAKK